MRLVSFFNVFLLVIVCSTQAFSQLTYPQNGVHDERDVYTLLRHATIYTDAEHKITDGEILIKEGKIIAIGSNIKVPSDVQPVIVDMHNKYVYPAFIDIYSSFGVKPKPTPKYKKRREYKPQMDKATDGPFSWNDAVHPQVNAYELIHYDKKTAAKLRKMGIAVVLSHQQDGIARGTGALVVLNDKRENLSLLKLQASTHLSFSKGTSTQDYPYSLMGSIALLRQTYLDANWYNATYDKKEGKNVSLMAFNKQLNLPTIFETTDKWDCLRANRVADEFNQNYIIKAAGNEYQIIDEIKATNAKYILPLKFPLPLKIKDDQIRRFIPYKKLKHWEMAPSNPYFFQSENIPFCFTFAGLNTVEEVLKNIRKSVRYGLDEALALAALTSQPAKFLGVDNEMGSLAEDKWANLVICDAPLFEDKSTIIETWVQGKRHIHSYNNFEDGYYKISLQNANQSFSQSVKVNNGKFYVESDEDTVVVVPTLQTNMITFTLAIGGENYSLSGIFKDRFTTYGTASDEGLNAYTWSMVWTNRLPTKRNKVKRSKPKYTKNDLRYPFIAYGNKRLPKQQNILIKNATIWTNTEKGILQQADVLVLDGKIRAVGKKLASVGKAVVIDGTDMHLTPGIIDEHSHIAITKGVNEGTQAVTSEVRIGDVLNPDDINIYRQLSGGVTTSHILHGSANPIGGQTQLIKLRWGKPDYALKFNNWTPFIKFALGENVKQSNWGDNYTVRFPQTRMGVAQVYEDAFTRAQEYEKQKQLGIKVKPDLELDALVEILNAKRFITCHSYIQSEINMMMHIADKFGFTLNTFTHILEGYKVADKMKKHGANASTFSDWGTYKYEVNDAIPYNASIMQKVGLNVAINSDDAEMARRLNQEAAKMVRYGGVDEQEALKSVTLNPAKMLHIDKYVGSIAVGKDADLVLWTTHPLSVYAVVEKTIIDGTIYYDKSEDLAINQRIFDDKKRIFQNMKKAINKGAKAQPANINVNNATQLYGCDGKIANPYFQAK